VQVAEQLFDTGLLNACEIGRTRARLQASNESMAYTLCLPKKDERKDKGKGENKDEDVYRRMRNRE
jgi:hypothetical protein